MIRKRSVTIRGHRTSFSIEDEFWLVLKEISSKAGQSMAQLITKIDAKRDTETNLSSALRIHVLNFLKENAD